MCEYNYQNFLNFALDYTQIKQGDKILRFVRDDESCAIWQNRLIEFVINDENSFYIETSKHKPLEPIVFSKEELPLMLTNGKEYVATIDIVEENSSLRIKRLFIDEIFRSMHIGTQIMDCIKLYAKLTKKTIDLHVYSSSAENFYISQGLKLYYKDYIFKGENNDN